MSAVPSSRLPKPNTLPGPRYLADTPRRVLLFLRTAGSNAEVRLALATVGYRQRHHDEGIALLSRAVAYGSTDAAIEALLAGPRRDPRAAERALHEFAQRHVGRLAAAVRRLSPEEAERIFEGLLPCPRAKAILHADLFLRRLDEHASPRVLALLEARGVGAAERDRLAALIDEARATERPGPSREAFHAVRRAELAALWAWWAEWSAAAQSVITRRDQRVQLGIGEPEGRGGVGAR